MDIDIDLPTTFDPIDTIPGTTRASRVDDGRLLKHNAGAYLQNIPIDPITQLAAIPYDKAEEFGYIKIDFLHLAVLDDFTSKQQIRTLINTPPDWSMLTDPDIVPQLFQVHSHFDLLSQLKPQSVQELADCIALIRPSKRALIPKFISTHKDRREVLRKVLYTKPLDGRQYFKKGHAISYALTIILQLHHLKQTQP